MEYLQSTPNIVLINVCVCLFLPCNKRSRLIFSLEASRVFQESFVRVSRLENILLLLNGPLGPLTFHNVDPPTSSPWSISYSHKVQNYKQNTSLRCKKMKSTKRIICGLPNYPQHTQTILLSGFVFMLPFLFWYVTPCLIPVGLTFPILVTCPRPNGYHPHIIIFLSVSI